MIDTRLEHVIGAASHPLTELLRMGIWARWAEGPLRALARSVLVHRNAPPTAENLVYVPSWNSEARGEVTKSDKVRGFLPSFVVHFSS